MHFSWQISNMTYTRDLFKIKENILLEIWQIIKIIQKKGKKQLQAQNFKDIIGCPKKKYLKFKFFKKKSE